MNLWLTGQVNEEGEPRQEQMYRNLGELAGIAIVAEDVCWILNEFSELPRGT